MPSILWSKLVEITQESTVLDANLDENRCHQRLALRVHIYGAIQRIKCILIPFLGDLMYGLFLYPVLS